MIFYYSMATMFAVISLLALDEIMFNWSPTRLALLSIFLGIIWPITSLALMIFLSTLIKNDPRC